MRKMQKDIEREAFSSSKQAGYRGKGLASEAGWKMSSARYGEESKLQHPTGSPGGRVNGSGQRNS